MKIQLALDRMTIPEAIETAKKAEQYVDLIEVGTSLIKEYGVESISEIKKEFPLKPVLADMKTFDNAAYEFSIAFEAGADMATVMGAAPLVTIETCLKVAKENGKEVMIDLLNVTLEQRLRLLRYTSAVFCEHVSKDEQESDNKTMEKQTKDRLPVDRLALAGGIALSSLPMAAEKNPEIIVVGSAITKAANIQEAAKQMYTVWKTIRTGENV
ncbi:3-hexulose-6-phosphate synthase [Fictibacillus solisalsi]|uniref:3-hexulose-6-phosphate synthase n=1 Tax=Fictibacillus solisalsi TaxID=459525 RepID=A0A1G9WMB6_9BACL|nr:3-hexulose-6-phosphate synthase [Fictibacillus solisalsi]SDM85640.1 3-hexulose-6-phosphate synthase [Fictibacillus solisalsi]